MCRYGGFSISNGSERSCGKTTSGYGQHGWSVTTFLCVVSSSTPFQSMRYANTPCRRRKKTTCFLLILSSTRSSSQRLLTNRYTHLPEATFVSLPRRYLADRESHKITSTSNYLIAYIDVLIKLQSCAVSKRIQHPWCLLLLMRRQVKSARD